MQKSQTIVVKLGTSTLTKGTKKLSRKVMLDLVRQMAALHELGHQIVLVTSGAVAAGREILNNPKLDATVPSKQMLSSIGQVRLMQIWSELFGIFEIPVSQVLLTHGDFSNRKRYLNVRDTLKALLDHRVIPIINENDAVATQEIKVGDNDNLSAYVANLVAGNLLILITDQQGLFDADPRHNPQAKLIPIVEHIDEGIVALAGGTVGLGTGGMATKVQAAFLATQSGTPTVVASSSHPDVLLELAAGKHVGTLFKSQISLRESRKRWILSEKPQGSIHIDAGAEKQVRQKGASLLAVGITKIDNEFERGAVVNIMAPSNKKLGVGVTSYSSEEIKQLIGSHSGKIEEILGYSYGTEVIHRDNFSLLASKDEE